MELRNAELAPSSTGKRFAAWHTRQRQRSLRRQALTGGRLSAARPRLPVIVAIAAAAILGRISPAVAQEASLVTGIITVRENGSRLEGATVRIPSLQLSATTDEHGRYALRIPRSPSGARTVDIVVTFGGAAPLTRTVVLQSGTLEQNFALSIGFAEVVTVGSRASGAEAEKSVPVDIITAQDLVKTGATETMQALQALLPSFSFPRPTISDGTDSVRPATLRGLGPDQVLVLVNGKRRHQTALVHVNNTIGRGAAGVDLNAIPVAAIERVEVLREGAAAQYGSDAIAGVINVVLKSGPSRPRVEAQIGGNFGSFQDVFGTDHEFSDGGTIDLQATDGFRLGPGFVTVAGEYRDRRATNRAGPDTGDAFGPQPNIHWGEAEEKNGLLFANFEHPLTVGEHTAAYAFGGWSRRSGSHGGNYRRRIDSGNLPQIYPNGFLPLIEPINVDASLAAGVRGTSGRAWFWDISGAYGHNRLDYYVSDSLNVSLGPSVPPNQTEFYSGAIAFNQLSLNMDARRSVSLRLLRPWNLAFGFEYRRDTYQIVSGEEASYIDGGMPDQFGNPAIPGAQVFPGFRPSNETDASRDSVGLYADLEGDVAAWLRLGFAGRYERYEDFGNTGDGKVTVRVAPTRKVVVRGAASTGFRAPSLGQIHFSTVSTNFILLNGAFVPVEAGTYPVDSAQAIALGATPLRPEESVNVSAGVAINAIDPLDITVDLFRIAIDDRIVLSDNFTGAQIAELLRPFGANGARFFTNAIDTTTKGIDVVASYTRPTLNAGTYRVHAAYNHTDTRITRISPTPPQLAGLDNTLFSRTPPNDVEVRRFTCAQPEHSVRLVADWEKQPVNAFVRAARIGEYCSIEAIDQRYRAQWVTDLEMTYRLGQTLVGFGIQNLANTLPDGNLASVSNRGGRTFPRNAPFGFNGRYVYLRLGYTF